MSALPPTASANPDLAAVAAKPFPSGNEMEDAVSQPGNPDRFAAHFQRLLGKQPASELVAEELPVNAEKTAIDADPADELDALLPFIEALGLTQASSNSAAEVTAEDREAFAKKNIIAADAMLVNIASLPAHGASPLALASIPLASSASSPAANPFSVNTVSVAPGDPMSLTSDGASPLALASTPLASSASSPAASSPNAPAISAAHPSPQGQTHGLAFEVATQPAEAAAETLPNAIAGNGAPSGALPAGREFSAQPVEAIAASKETQHLPGTPSAAVQNIVSQAVSGRTTGQEVAPTVTQAVGSSGWVEEIGNHVAWLVSRSESKAELVLTPPQMGRIEISLSVRGEQATASFASSNPVVREALEAALPRLREVLADAGIQLGQTQVGAENASHWAQQEKHGGNSASDHDRGHADNAAISRVSSGSLSTDAILKRGRGLVDVFA